MYQGSTSNTNLTQEWVWIIGIELFNLLTAPALIHQSSGKFKCISNSWNKTIVIPFSPYFKTVCAYFQGKNTTKGLKTVTDLSTVLFKELASVRWKHFSAENWFLDKTGIKEVEIGTWNHVFSSQTSDNYLAGRLSSRLSCGLMTR